MRVCIRFLGRWAPADSSGGGSSCEAGPSVVGDAGGLIFSIFPAMIWKRMTHSKLRTHKLFSKDEQLDKHFQQALNEHSLEWSLWNNLVNEDGHGLLKKPSPSSCNPLQQNTTKFFYKTTVYKSTCLKYPFFLLQDTFLWFGNVCKILENCKMVIFSLSHATLRDHAQDIQRRHLVKHSCLLFFQCFLPALQARKALGQSPVLLFHTAVSCRLHRVLLW